MGDGDDGGWIRAFRLGVAGGIIRISLVHVGGCGARRHGGRPIAVRVGGDRLLSALGVGDDDVDIWQIGFTGILDAVAVDIEIEVAVDRSRGAVLITEIGVQVHLPARQGDRVRFIVGGQFVSGRKRGGGHGDQIGTGRHAGEQILAVGIRHAGGDHFVFGVHHAVAVEVTDQIDRHARQARLADILCAVAIQVVPDEVADPAVQRRGIGHIDGRAGADGDAIVDDFRDARRQGVESLDRHQKRDFKGPAHG